MLRYVVPNKPPAHPHDCEECLFHGTENVEGKQVDFYTCGDSVVARDGPEGPDYRSFRYDISLRDRPFFEAHVAGGRRILELAALVAADARK